MSCGEGGMLITNDENLALKARELDQQSLLSPTGEPAKLDRLKSAHNLLTLIADEVDFPQILYNVPSRTGCDLLNETVLRLVDHQNIVGLKDATGDLGRLEDFMTNLDSEQKTISDYFKYKLPTLEYLIFKWTGKL